MKICWVLNEKKAKTAGSLSPWSALTQDRYTLPRQDILRYTFLLSSHTMYTYKLKQQNAETENRGTKNDFNAGMIQTWKTVHYYLQMQELTQRLFTRQRITFNFVIS